MRWLWWRFVGINGGRKDNIERRSRVLHFNEQLQTDGWAAHNQAAQRNIAPPLWPANWHWNDQKSYKFEVIILSEWEHFEGKIHSSLNCLLMEQNTNWKIERLKELVIAQTWIMWQCLIFPRFIRQHVSNSLSFYSRYDCGFRHLVLGAISAVRRHSCRMGQLSSDPSKHMWHSSPEM